MPTAKPVIGYLLKTFPKLSETFILNEILELERQGVNLHIFSLRSPQDQQQHPGVSQVKASVTYIPSLLPDCDSDTELTLLQKHHTLLQLFPDLYQELWHFYLARPEEKHINEFLQAGHLALEMIRLGIEHLHVHFANGPTATAEMACLLSGISYSVTAHAKDIYLSDRAALDRRFNGAEFVLTCTDYNRRYLESISTSKTPIYRAYHGIDLSRFKANSPKAGWLSAGRESQPQVPTPMAGAAAVEPATTPVKLLSVGRFCQKKGFPYLLQACGMLKDLGLPFDCRLVGYGPLQAQIEAQIKDLNLHQDVTLVGQLTQDQVIEQYRWADVFVLPCLVTEDGDRDGIPNVLLEAMAMEVPVISTDISGISELIASLANGLLVPPQNVTDLAMAIARLALDPDLRRRLGQAGCRTVRQQFTLETNVGQVKQLLLDTLRTQPFPRQLLSPTLESII